MNKTIWKILATSNTSDSNFNANISQWIEASSSEDKDIGMHKCRRKINDENKNEEVKGAVVK